MGRYAAHRVTLGDDPFATVEKMALVTKKVGPCCTTPTGVAGTHDETLVDTDDEDNARNNFD